MREGLQPGLQNQTAFATILKFCSVKNFCLNTNGECYKENSMLKRLGVTFLSLIILVVTVVVATPGAVPVAIAVPAAASAVVLRWW